MLSAWYCSLEVREIHWAVLALSMKCENTHMVQKKKAKVHAHTLTEIWSCEHEDWVRNRAADLLGQFFKGGSQFNSQKRKAENCNCKLISLSLLSLFALCGVWLLFKPLPLCPIDSDGQKMVQVNGTIIISIFLPSLSTFVPHRLGSELKQTNKQLEIACCLSHAAKYNL